MKSLFTPFVFLLLLMGCLPTTAQKATTTTQVVYAQDIYNFWEAYDLIVQTNDVTEQLAIIREYYTDKASPGLQAYMQMRRVKDSMYVHLINELPRFWESVRPKTLEAIDKAMEAEAAVARLRSHYPDLKQAEAYLFIGGLVSGGTVMDDKVLIGCEISAADGTVDLSELEASHHAWVVPFIRSSTSDSFLQMIAHEYGHTQQQGAQQNVLCKSINEGTCDFVAEIALGKPVSSHYITYGYEHFETIKAEFKEDLFTDYVSDWMYGENSRGHARDLGYFMGYVICKAYYEQAQDKQAALKTIIELDHKDTDAVLAFLNESGFYEEPITGPPPAPEYPEDVCQVTFKVTVPNETDEIFITGNRPDLGEWDPSKVKLEKTGPLERSITLELQAPIEFKITKGNWDVQGRVAEGRGWSNLKAGFFEDTTLEYTVVEWSGE